MNQRGRIAARLGTRLASFLVIAAMLLYAAVHYERPSEPELCESHAVAESTQDLYHANGTSESATTLTVAPCRDLNAATVEELMRVEGIGAVLAEKIVAARKQCGGFQRRSDLLGVEGIGEELMNRIMMAFFITDELPYMVSDTTAMPAATEMETTITAGKYDLNHVTKEELMRIPDMTETLAEGILTLRAEIKYYTHLYELLYVDGIDGRYLLEVLEQHLYVTS